jgi:1,4-alpha-glucan branching enzyme
LLNSDAETYGGSGQGNFGAVAADCARHHEQPCSLTLSLPPLGVAFFKGIGERAPAQPAPA